MLTPNPHATDRTAPPAQARRRARFAAAIALPVAAAIVLAGCATAAEPAVVVSDDTSTQATESSSAAGALNGSSDAHQSAADVLAANQETHDDADDAEYNTAGAIEITLEGDGASADGEAVSVDGSTVTITAAGTYLVSGELQGSLTIDSTAEGTVTLVLDGVDITNAAGAAIDVVAADEAVIVLAEGSVNTLSDASSYADDAEANAALYSAADLTITGTGALTVHGNGNDGIASADGLVIQSGTIEVDALDDGVRGKDYLVIRDGDLEVTAGGDGLKSDNEEDAERGYILVEGGTIAVDAGLDAFTDVVTTAGTITVVTGSGADAATTEGTAHGVKAGVIAVLEGGTIDIDAAADAINTDAYAHLAGATLTASAGDDAVHADLQLVISAGVNVVSRAVEGLESGDIEISGGETSVVADDDAVNVSTPDAGSAAMTLLISGGTLTAIGGGDGIDVNGTWSMTGGTVVAAGPAAGGDGAIDADGGIQISGGTLVALGGTPSVPTDAGQSAAQFSLTVAEGDELVLTDAAGTTLATVVAPASAASVIVSAAGVASGSAYTLTASGTTVTATAGELTGTMGGGGMGGGQGGPGRP
jgi:hypothetical protein